MAETFATKPALRAASRLPVLSRDSQVTAAEIALLLACGGLAAAAVGLVHLRMGIPGHAILRAVLPMAMGLALVPRRNAGMVMALGAGATSAAMTAANLGYFAPASVLAVLALGPILDIALLGRPHGWRLYVRFLVAGAAANLLAFAVKAATLRLGWELAGGRHFMSFVSTAFVSVVLCGALAGLVSAVVWFRLRESDDLRRS